MAVGDKFFSVMKNELAVSNGVATLGPDGLLNASQRPITDSMPTQGSSNPVQSGGVYSALSNKADKVTLLGNVDCNTLFTPGDYIIRMDPATAEQSVACNLPNEPGHWSLSIYATLEVTGNNGTVYVARNRDSGNIYSRQSLNGSFWPWVKLATATPPQQFDLPLAEGVSGAIRYSKDQMGVVRLLGQVELSSAQSGIISIGTLPEGFRLEYAVTTVCCGWTDGGATIAPCTAVVNADGLVAINAFDASLKVFAVNISFCWFAMNTNVAANPGQLPKFGSLDPGTSCAALA